MMTDTLDWQPVLGSHELTAGRNVVAACAQGTELALWRASDGSVQAWEDRCPHRSVRLSIGQVVGDRLSCAYHGWQFQAGSGACAGIPAHPQMEPPETVRVAQWPVVEVAGMVWVDLSRRATRSPDATSVPAGWRFCRTLGVRAPMAALQGALADHGWTRAATGWSFGGDDTRTQDGQLPVVEAQARAFALQARAELTMVHVWTDAAPGSAPMRALHAMLRAVRDLALAYPAPEPKRP